MSSFILRVAARVLLPLMLLLSIVMLLRGHNEPGGGFVGGLLAASGFALHAICNSSASARATLRVSPITLIGVGLLLGTASGFPAMFQGLPYLEGLWISVSLVGMPDPIKLGTPLVFDIGVYLLVLGGVLLMLFELAETAPSEDTP